MNTNIDLGEFAGIVAGLLLIGAIIKNAFPAFPNRFIPLLTWALGVPAYLILCDDWTDPRQWLAAIITAATATGTHSALKNTIGTDIPKAAAPLLLAAMLLPLAGCRSLDPAGPYAGDSVLYSADLTIATSYDLIHTYVAWEYENRQALSIWPEIKQSADTMRRHAKQWFGTAKALRAAYAANPSPENSDALHQALAILRTALNEATGYMAKTATQ